MNITEFAEQIVFGTTLEDKLIVPGKLTYDRPRSTMRNLESVPTPGRQRGLEMLNEKGGNAQPPSDQQLENESSRGQLLHFLANHELLATELMALVLLKFPDAPHAFRQGILVTLQEEQAHTRMYLHRMRECGVELGQFPLSGQFWRIVEPMQSPMDFVSRLSLTFEQANLDYSLHFAKVFKRIGDLETSNLLQQIYEDEIGHVQHGLHWFRQWKKPDQSDWEAYQASLEFPMSPQRALGPRAMFNRAGRLAAGLSESFIDAIEVYRESRGRAPVVHWFDPAAEAKLAGEISPKENALMAQLGADLEMVMVALAKQDDVVLVRRMPSRALRKHLIDVGFDLPQFVLMEHATESLKHRKIHSCSPWAWTPDSRQIAETLGGSVHLSPPGWRNEWGELFKKSWSTGKLGEWLRGNDGIEFIEPTIKPLTPSPSPLKSGDGSRFEEGRSPLKNGEGSKFEEGRSPLKNGEGSRLRDGLLMSESCVGISVSSVDEITYALRDFGKRGYSSALFKQDLATSGRGQRRLDCAQPLNEQDATWLTAMMGSGGGIVEPELDRVLDLSFLFRMSADAASSEFLGWTRPIASVGRKYVGTRLRDPLADCEPGLKRFLLENKAWRLHAVVDWLTPRLNAELQSRNFFGYFGVDAMVCRDAAGELKIKPLVELNPRTTMGHVALALKKRVAPSTPSEFRIFTADQWAGLESELKQIPFEQSRDGWKSGVISVGTADSKSKLNPVVLVGAQAVEFLNGLG